MNCKSARELIEPYQENSLNEDNEAMLLDHLGSCQNCRIALVELDALDKLLKDVIREPSPSAGFAEATIARLPEHAPEPISGHMPSVQALWRPALAATIAISIASWFMIQDAQRSPKLAKQIARVTQISPFEPDASLDFAIGKPFMIQDGETLPYTGEATIRISRVVRGAPELIVDAFPNLDERPTR